MTQPRALSAKTDVLAAISGRPASERAAAFGQAPAMAAA